MKSINTCVVYYIKRANLSFPKCPGYKVAKRAGLLHINILLIKK